MLACLITHPGDRQLTVNLCARIAQLGGVRSHECLIVSPNGTDMSGIEPVMKRAFGSVYTHQYAATMNGWPAGPNEAVAYAMLHIWGSAALRYHYLILEPDCVPVGERWLDMIDTAYRQAGDGRHVLGVKTDTRNQHGQAIGRHTVGVAVYPKNWPQICTPIQKLIETTFSYVAQRVPPPPWDAYTGAYTNRCTAETTLIQHFNVQPTSEGGRFRWDCTVESALAQVNPKAVLLHGCKNPEFLSRVTGFKPQPIETHVPTKAVLADVSAAASTIPTARQEIPQLAEAQSAQSRSADNGPVLSIRSRRDELDSMKWPAFKQYAASIGANTFKVKRPELTEMVLEIEDRELSKPELPVEEAAPPLTPPPPSMGIQTARPWNSVDVADTGISDGMQQRMKDALRESIARRAAAGLV